jgi:anti-sigma factor RsiW
MKCEEFEAIGLDAERDGSLSVLERAAAREHASSCSRCAALQDLWQAASAELRFFSDATRAPQTPPRVEMRLRQEFRTQHRTLKTRRAAMISAWALATAAVLLGAVSWKNWRDAQRLGLLRQPVAARAASNTTGDNASAAANDGASPRKSNAAMARNSVSDNAAETLVADNDLRDFVLLPGSFTAETEDAAIVRVRMQRGALGALGLPVNEDRAGDWIQVDLLVGNDGLPQGVRLPR